MCKRFVKTFFYVPPDGGLLLSLPHWYVVSLDYTNLMSTKPIPLPYGPPCSRSPFAPPCNYPIPGDNVPPPPSEELSDLTMLLPFDN